MNIKYIAGSLLTALVLTACSKTDYEEPVVTLPEDVTLHEEGPASPLSVSGSTPLNNQHRIIYEMNLYNFTPEGTLAAAQQHLERLKNIGVDIIWLMPIQKRTDLQEWKDYLVSELGSPYSLKDYKLLNPDHGTMDDLKSFINAAHGKGMKVWLDWVANHTAWDNVWLTTHPEYYTQDAEGKPVSPIDYKDVAELNMSKTETQDAMIDAMKYWVTEADFDGFRCDYVSSPTIPVGFWNKAIAAIKAMKPGMEFMAETDFTDHSEFLDCGFDFDYAWGFNGNLQGVGSGMAGSALYNFAEPLISDARFDHMGRMVYVTNHDLAHQKSLAAMYGDNRYLMSVISFGIYGMPLIFNGLEIGENKTQDPFNKDVIDWNNVDVKMQNTINTLAFLKHTVPALADGSVEQRAATGLPKAGSGNVFAFTRTKGDSKILFVVNLGANQVNTRITGIEAGQYTKVLDSRTIATAGPQQSEVTLSPYYGIYLESKGYRVYIKK